MSNRGTSASRARRTRCRPAPEGLERRELLTTGTQPYFLTGDRWSDATPITFSIAADGVMWDRNANVLNAVMDARFATDVWQDEIARALQTWASAADIDFVRVADSALGFDTHGEAQGDIRFGDIRFGGYDFGNASQLAHAYSPPPNGSTGAGDVAVNTAMAFNIGSEFDLYSVLLHETGHSLGLGHPDNSDVVMGVAYEGVRASLDAGDIAGIRAIYGARVDDIYGQQSRGSGLADAVDVAAGNVTPNTFALRNLALTAIGDSDYFSVVAPTSGASLRVMAIAGGVSMLSAQVSVYDASGARLDLQGDASSYGQDVMAGVAGVVAGQRYYIKVAGATNDVFSIGSYDLQVAFTDVEPLVAATALLVASVTQASPAVEPGPPPASAIAVEAHPVSPPSAPVLPPSDPVPPPLPSPAVPHASPPPAPHATPAPQPAPPPQFHQLLKAPQKSIRPRFRRRTARFPIGRQQWIKRVRWVRVHPRPRL